MRFNPADAVANLWPENWYDSVVIAAEERPSKRGNDMLVVTFRCYGGPTSETDIPVYFVSGNPSSISRLEKLCKATGIAFSNGEVTPDQIKGKSPKVLVKIQKDDTGQFSDKNVIAGFQMTAGTQIVAPGEKPPMPDDEIPF